MPQAMAQFSEKGGVVFWRKGYVDTNCGVVTSVVIAGHDNNTRSRNGDRRLFCDDVGESRLKFDRAISDDDGVWNVHKNVSEIFKRFV